METLPITLTIAGAAALLNIWLGLRVSLLRRKLKVSIGHGGQSVIAVRMRAHANYIEYAPFFLILLLLVELAKGTQTWLWLVAIAFILGRLLHAFGMDRKQPSQLRVAGIVITWAVLLGLGGYAISIPYSQGREAPSILSASAP